MFWLFFANFLFYSFFMINIAYLQGFGESEKMNMTPYFTFLHLALVAFLIFGIVEVFNGSVFGLVAIIIFSAGSVLALPIYYIKRKDYIKESYSLFSKVFAGGYFLLSLAIIIVIIVLSIMNVID